MVNWSEHTKRTLLFNCSNTTQGKTKTRKVRKVRKARRGVRRVLIIGKARKTRNLANSWCIGYRYCTTSFSKAWTQVLCRFKTWSRRVEDSRWWGNKAKRLSSVNHATKTIHHHQSFNLKPFKFVKYYLFHSL